MGVNVRAYLAAGTRIKDVADVAAILLGNKAVKTHFGNYSTKPDGYYVHAEGVTIQSSSEVTMPNIVITLNPDNPAAAQIIKSDGEKYHISYFFESGPNGEAFLYPKSTAAKIALARGIVKFFGGTIDYSDCDDVSINYRAPRQPDNHAEDGKLWYSLQDRKFSLKPLTQKDLDRYQKYAAY